MPSPAVSCDAIITSVRTRADNSLGLSVQTPELQPDEQLVFLQLKNRNLKMVLQPVDDVPAELKEVRAEFERKSPSVRLRAVLYRLWEQQESEMPFQDWYIRRMEKIIDEHKSMLEPRV